MLRRLPILLLLAAVPVPAIVFAPGQSSATVSGTVERGSADTWRFDARAGQTADIRITSADSNASFVIYAPGDDIKGRALPGGDPEKPPLDAGAQKHWRGTLPASGSYLVSVVPDRGGATYKLTTRIR